MTNTISISLCLLTGSILFQPDVFAQQPSEIQGDVGQSQTVTPIRQAEALDQIEAAYQKEYAFLEGQLRDLRQRSAVFAAESRQNESAKAVQIDRTKGEWITLQSQSERLQNRLTEAERELEAMDEAQTTLTVTIEQAGATLKPYKIEVLQGEPYLAASDGMKIDILFGQAIRLLERIGKVQEAPGAFFLRDGTEVEGRILRIGNIAAYGFSDLGNGALAPAGENRMKVWSEPAAATAAALAAGLLPTRIGIFVFESESRAIEETAKKTVLGVIRSGGTIAWTIVALGFFALFLIILRLVFLRNAGAATGKIVAAVGGLVRCGQIDEALKACKSFKGATARVVAAAVRNLERDRNHLEDIISEAILHESSHLNQFGAMILVIAAVSPLLGLLGTVTGMITTFDIITEFGTGDPKLLSGGISIALVTTEIGLVVAIPALLLGNVLSGWAERIKDDMEKGALGVINQFKEHRRTA